MVEFIIQKSQLFFWVVPNNKNLNGSYLNFLHRASVDCTSPTLPHEQVFGNNEKEKLPFNRKKSQAEPTMSTKALFRETSVF